MHRWISAALVILVSCRSADAVTDEHIDALPALVLAEQMRIGDVDDPDVGFSRITGVDVDRDGNTFVVEGAVPEIRVYGPDGALLRRFGRRGEGPGEFRFPPRMGVRGDTVWTIESLGVARLTLFDREGKVLATGRTQGLRVPLPSSSGYVVPWLMRSDGRFTSHFGMVMSSRDDPPTGVKPTDSIPVPHVLFDVSGEVVDTVGWADRPPPRMWRPPSQESGNPELVEVGGRRLLLPSAPTTLPFWEPLRDGYLLVETPLAQTERDGVIRVQRMGLGGDTVFASTLRYRPERWTSEDLDSLAAGAARGGGIVMRGGGAPAVPEGWEGIARQLRDRMAFPEFKLPLQYIWVGQDESIWLRRRSSAGAPGEAVEWVVLDARGRPRGRLELPANVRILWSRDDIVWAVVPDENDVQWLVRYGIERE